jgi:hypothetical protein
VLEGRLRIMNGNHTANIAAKCSDSPALFQSPFCLSTTLLPPIWCRKLQRKQKGLDFKSPVSGRGAVDNRQARKGLAARKCILSNY